MKQWTDWEVVRRQVAVAGRVVDGKGKSRAAIQVTVTAVPKRSRQKTEGAVSTAENVSQRGDEPLDTTLTRPDGIFYFLDMPAGRYTVQGIDQQLSSQDQKVVTVAWDQSKNVKRVKADLTVPKVEEEDGNARTTRKNVQV